MNNLEPKPYSDSDEIDLLALAGSLWDGRWIIAVATGLFTIGGLAYALTATPIYRANSLIQVEEKQGALPGMEDLSSLLSTSSTATTEIELIKSRSVLGKVVDELNLDVLLEPNYFPVVGKALARRFHGAPGELADPVLGEGFAWGGEAIDVSRFEVPDWMQGQALILEATQQGWKLQDQDGNVLLEGRVGEPAENGDYALTVARFMARPGTRFYISKQSRFSAIAGLQSAVMASEKGRDSGILSLSYEHEDHRLATRILDSIGEHYVRQNVDRNSAEAAKSLAFLREQLPQVKTDLEKAEADLNAYQVRAETVDISAESEALLDQTVELEKSISELEIQRAEIEQRFRPTHPRYKAWVSQMAELEQRRAELNKRISNLPETHQKLIRLRRDVEVGNEIYLQMLSNIQQLTIARAGTVGNVRIVDKAAANTLQPVAPKRSLIVLGALFCGAFVGTGVVLGRLVLHRGVEKPEEIENLGLPVYSSIPLSNTQKQIGAVKKFGRNRSRLLAVENPADLAVEALRSLRTSLHFGMMRAKNKVLLISGPSPGVGKTFVSTNLASVIALADQKVLLIDADMRKGTSHETLSVSNHPGLSDVLSDKAPLQDALQHSEVKNLDFIPRGAVPPHPSELLMTGAFESLLERLTGQYDLIIIDTPPILAVTDAALVGKHAGTTLLVTRFGLNPAKEIETAKRRFELNGIQVGGVVFNAVEKKASSYGYGGYYNYAYESAEE